MKLIKLFLMCAILVPCAVVADEPAPMPRRVNVFSTSTDWESLTGHRATEYRVSFSGDAKLGGDGLVLFYLDGFPCYGMGDRARVWIGPRNSDGEIRMVCVHAPVTVNFAWRVAARDDRDRTTTGMLTCDTDVDGRDIKINLSKCTRGPDWNEYK